MIKTSFAFLFLTFAFNFCFGQTDSLRLYYGIDVFRLDEGHERSLDTTFSQLDSMLQYKVDVIGIADYLGSASYNVTLSRRRAVAVADYLIAHFEDRIATLDVLARGEQTPESFPADPLEGVQDHRKVTVVIQWPEPSPPSPAASSDIEQLAELESGGRIVLKNLNFQPGRHILLERSIPILHKLLEVLEESPNLKIEIQGHVCCTPPGQEDGLDIDTNEEKLSVNRAQSIYEYLIKNGVAEDRLSYQGFGFSQPLVFPEVTAEDQISNRRVEIKVISNE